MKKNEEKIVGKIVINIYNTGKITITMPDNYSIGYLIKIIDKIKDDILNSIVLKPTDKK